VAEKEEKIEDMTEMGQTDGGDGMGKRGGQLSRGRGGEDRGKGGMESGHEGVNVKTEWS
jgi:hypothetical protein